MSVGLSGNLVDFGIADVFQLIGQQRKTGVLELKSASARIQLVFDRGLIVSAGPAISRAGDLDPIADRLVRCGQITRERADEAMSASRAAAQSFAKTVVERGWVRAELAAEAEELVTRDTIFEVLRWTAGSFDFRAERVSHDRDPARLLGAEQILMDGLRMADEWSSFAALVPSEETIFEPSGSLEAYLASGERRGDEEVERVERVFALVDGRLSARRVIDLARLGTFDGTRCLSALRQAGAIHPLHAEGLARLRRRRRAPGDRGAALRRALAAALPLAVLAGVVWWTADSAATPSVVPAGRIERHDLAGLREAYAARGARHAIEAYRFGRGNWPRRLEELEAAGLVAPGALATPDGRPYYSVHREQGLVFLAPER